MPGGIGFTSAIVNAFSFCLQGHKEREIVIRLANIVLISPYSSRLLLIPGIIWQELSFSQPSSQLTRKSEDAQLREVEQIYASAVYALAEADRLLDKAKRYRKPFMTSVCFHQTPHTLFLLLFAYHAYLPNFSEKRLEMIEAEKKPIVELVNKAKEFLG